MSSFVGWTAATLAGRWQVTSMSKVMYGLSRYSGVRSAQDVVVFLNIAKKCLHGRLEDVNARHWHDGGRPGDPRRTV